MSKINLYNVWTAKYFSLQKTGNISNGKTIVNVETTDLKNHLCILNKEKNKAIDIATQEAYPILKRNKYNQIIDSYELKPDERYVVSIEPETSRGVKLLVLKHKYKKEVKKSEI